MVNCSSLLIMAMILVLVYMITASKKHNICYLISICFAIAFSWIFYFLISKVFDLSSLALNFGKLFTRFKSLPLEDEKIISFSYGLWMIILFIILFIFSEIISIKYLIKENYFLKHNNSYYTIKTVVIFFNFLFSIYAIIFAITELNILYNAPNGFLKFIFELATEGIYQL